MKTFKLPSGKELSVTMGSFSESKSFYQAVLKSAKKISMGENVEIDTNFIKDIFCELLSDKEIEENMNNLLKRCLYGKQKIDPDETFESEEARGDYFEIMRFVAEVNIAPFVKSLVQKYGAQIETLKQIFQQQNSKTTTT